eukprot:12982156-Heterocapsa_arctica.AAC.1
MAAGGSMEACSAPTERGVARTEGFVTRRPAHGEVWDEGGGVRLRFAGERRSGPGSGPGAKWKRTDALVAQLAAEPKDLGVQIGPARRSEDRATRRPAHAGGAWGGDGGVGLTT